MRKIIIAAIIGLAPVAAFAEVQFGPTAMLNFPMTTGDLLDSYDAANLGIDDFTFGADFRVDLDPLQVSAYALYTPGFEYVSGPDSFLAPGWINLYADVGLTFKILFLRASVGVGPSLGIAVGGDTDYQQIVNDAVNYGFNTKAMVDFYFGSIALSAVYLADFDLSDPAGAFTNIDGYFGLSLLFSF